MAHVQVLHPVPVVRRAHRGRIGRPSLLVHATPVELAEADVGDFEPLDFVPMAGDPPDVPCETGYGLLAYRGGVWTRLLVRAGNPWREENHRPLRRDEFVSFLEGDHHHAMLPPRGDLRPHFSRTPLLAGSVATTRGDHTYVSETRGDRHLDPTDADEEAIHHASRAVSDFVSSDVRIVGGDVMVRVPGPLAVRFGPAPDEPYRLSVFPRGHGTFDSVASPASLADLAWLHARLAEPPGSFSVTGDPGFGIPSHLIGDDDVLLAVTDMSRTLLDACASLGKATVARVGPEARERVAIAATRLRLLDAYGRTGTVPGGSLRDAVSELEGHVATLRAARPRSPGFLAFEAGYLSSVAVPRMHARVGMDPDMDAMEGLGMAGPMR